MLCRCKGHEWPDNKQATDPYVAKIKPAGKTNEGIICGLCEKPGAIFLNTREYEEYKMGERLFAPRQADTLHIKLSDNPEKVHERNSAADTSW